MTSVMGTEELESLLLKKLDLDKNLTEVLKNHTYPFDNIKDYIKYGNTFLKLEKRIE